MRILMLSWEYPPHLIGGLGAHVAELVPALAAQGIDLTLVTPRWKGGDTTERINENALVYRVDPPVQAPGNYYADAQQTNLVLQEFAEELWEQGGGYDLIHAHDWLVSFAAEALKKRHKVPLVATMHATERGRGGGFIHGEMAEAINGAEWWLTYEAWHVITTSHYMAREMVTDFDLPPDKISVIPNGVNPARFDEWRMQDMTAFRDTWALPDEKIVFYIGRMEYEKGLHLLIEAAHRILARGVRAKFIFAGKGSMLGTLRQRVAELGIRDRVILPGYIEDVERDCLYAVADTAVFPSLYEPFGIVALEAMAAQCPVIVSDVGGLGEVVQDGVTGVKIPPYNLDFLADAIEYQLMNPARAGECAQRAYEAVCRDYAWDRIAQAKISLYNQIVRARAEIEWD